MVRLSDATVNVRVNPVLDPPLTRLAAYEAAAKKASRVDDIIRLAEWILGETRSPELAAVADIGGVEAEGWAPHTVIDKDGDVWRRTDDGRYGRYAMASFDHDDTYSISYVRSQFGPLRDVSALTERSP